MPIYNLNGDTYNIPDNVVDQFESENPNATVQYSADGNDYDIPVNKKADFLKSFPSAQYRGLTVEEPKQDEYPQPTDAAGNPITNNGQPYSQAVLAAYNSPDNKGDNYKDLATLAGEMERAVQQPAAATIPSDTTSVQSDTITEEQRIADEEAARHNDEFWSNDPTLQARKRLNARNAILLDPTIPRDQRSIFQEENRQNLLDISNPRYQQIIKHNDAVEKGMEAFDNAIADAEEKGRQSIMDALKENDGFNSLARTMSPNGDIMPDYYAIRNGNEKSDPQKVMDKIINDVTKNLMSEEYFTKDGKMLNESGQYVIQDLRQRMIQQLVDARVPKSTAEYVVLNAIKNSDIGKLTRMATNTAYENWLDDVAASNYDAGFWEKVANGALTFGMNLPEYLGTGVAGGAVSKKIIGEFTERTANELVKRGLQKATAERAAQMVVNNSLRGSAVKLGAASASGATTFGLQPIIGEPINITYQSGQPGPIEGTVNAPGLKDYLIGTAKEIGKGSAMGALMIGGAAAKTVEKIAEGSVKEGLARGAAGLAYDSGVMSYFGLMDRKEQDPNFEITPETAAESFAESAASLMLLKVPHLFSLKGKINDAKEFNRKYNFTQEDRDVLKEMGIKNPLEMVEKLAYKGASPETISKSKENITLPSADGAESITAEEMQQLTNEYRSFMASEAPETLKAKAQYLIEGKMPATFSSPVDSRVIERNGKVYLETLNENGGVIESRKMKDLASAETERMKFNYDIDMNRTAAMERRLNEQEVVSDFASNLSQDYESARVKTLTGEELTREDRQAVYLYQNFDKLQAALERQAAGAELIPDEQALVDAMTGRTKAYVNRDNASRRVAAEVEQELGLHEGDVERAIRGHSKEEAESTGEQVFEVGNGTYRTNSEFNIVEKYREALLNRINANNANRNAEDVAKAAEATQQQDNTPRIGARDIVQPSDGGEPPTPPTPSAGTDGGGLSDGFNGGQNGGQTDAGSGDVPQDILPRREDAYNRGIAVTDDPTQLPGIAYDKQLATERVRSVFTGANPVTVQVVTKLMQAVDAGNDVEADRLMAEVSGSLGASQAEAIEQYRDAVETERGVEDAITNQTESYEEQQRELLQRIAAPDGTITPLTMKDGSTLYYINGELENRWGGVNAADESGNVQQIPNSDIYSVGESQSLNDILTQRVNDFAANLETEYREYSDGSRVKEGQLTDVMISGQPFSVTFAGTDASGNVILQMQDGSQIPMSPVDVQKAIIDARNLKVQQQLKQESDAEMLADQQQRFAKGIIGYNEGQPDLTAAVTDPTVAAEYLMTQFASTENPEKSRKQYLADVQNTKEQLKRREEEIKAEKVRLTQWLKGNEDIADPAEVEQVNQRIDQIDVALDDIAVRGKKYGDIRRNLMTPEEVNQMEQQRGKEVFKARSGYQPQLPQRNFTTNEDRITLENGQPNFGLTPVGNTNNYLLRNFAESNGAEQFVNDHRIALRNKQRDEVQPHINNLKGILNAYTTGHIELTPDEVKRTTQQLADLEAYQDALSQEAVNLRKVAEGITALYERSGREEKLTPEEQRGKALDKAKSVEDKIRIAKEVYKDYPEALDVLNDMEPRELDEFIASNLGPGSLNWEGFDQGERHIIGVQEAVFGKNGATRGIGKNYSTNAFNMYLAPTGEGRGFADVVHSIYEAQPDSGDGKQYTTEDISNGLIDLLRSAQKPSDISHRIIDNRIAEAEDIVQRQEEFDREMEEQAKLEEMQQWADAYHLNPEERADFEEFMKMPPTEMEQELINQIIAENEEQNTASKGVDQDNPSGEIIGNGQAGQVEIQGQGTTAESGGNTEQQVVISGTEASAESPTVPDTDVSGGTPGINESFPARLAEAKAETDVNPTEAQKKAGNYKMGHIKFGGYSMSIENPKGSIRSGVDKSGKPWSIEMKDTYGYIGKKYGTDGDHLDFFINDDADLDSWNGRVFVVDQKNEDGSFDEHKVMYGYRNWSEARKAFERNYEPGWWDKHVMQMTGVKKADFDKWLSDSDHKTKPFAEYYRTRMADTVSDPSEQLMADIKDREAAAAKRSEEQRKRDAIIERLKEPMTKDNGYQHLVDAYTLGDKATIGDMVDSIRELMNQEIELDLPDFDGEEVYDYTGNDPEKLAQEYIERLYQHIYLDYDDDIPYIVTGIKSPEGRAKVPASIRYDVDDFLTNDHKLGKGKLTGDELRNAMQNQKELAAKMQPLLKKLTDDGLQQTLEALKDFEDSTPVNAVLMEQERRADLKDAMDEVMAEIDKRQAANPTITLPSIGEDEMQYMDDEQLMQQRRKKMADRHTSLELMATNSRIKPGGPKYEQLLSNIRQADADISAIDEELERRANFDQYDMQIENTGEQRPATVVRKRATDAVMKVMDDANVPVKQVSQKEADQMMEMFTIVNQDALAGYARQMRPDNMKRYAVINSRDPYAVPKYFEKMRFAREYMLWGNRQGGLFKMLDLEAGNSQGNVIKQAASVQPQIDVWHGSGAVFTKFDHSHMGEGAGSQAFGWGTYLTNSKAIGKDYSNITSHGWTFNGKNRREYVAGKNYQEESIREILLNLDLGYHFAQAVGKVRNFTQSAIRDYEDNYNDLSKADLDDLEDLRNLLSFINSLKETDFERSPKNLYKVAIPDDTGNNYYEWYKAIDQETADSIKSALIKTLNLSEETPEQKAKIEKINRDFDDFVADGEDLGYVYNILQMYLKPDEAKNAPFNGSDKLVSEFLSGLGYVGIKYPAGTLMGGGEGATNYVVFKEDDAKIVQHIQFMIDDGAKPEPVYYSNAMKAVDGIKQEKATPEQWLKMIEKGGGLKAGEDKWIGLSDWLNSQKDKKSLTKQEVMDFIRQNQIEVQEQHYAEESDIMTEKLEQEIPGWKDAFGFDTTSWGDFGVTILDKQKAIEIFNKFNEQNPIDPNNFDKYDLGEIEEWAVDEASKTKTGNKVKSIETTRLGYTTSGLKNYREIVLTIPNIEPYSESDHIHFGDAGDGRAVAWVRFGDTTVSDPELSTKRENSEKKFYDFLDKMADKYETDGSGETTLDKLTPEERDEAERLNQARLDAIKAEDASTKNILVIDEIQSKRHQDAREKGYNNPHAYLKAKIGEYRDSKYEEKVKEADITNEDGRVIGTMFKEDGSYSAMSQDGTHMTSSRTTEKEALRALDSIDPAGGGVPAAPFEKNWHELAMKRMLRYAAENGYDKIAWTTGEQQAERYNIGNAVQEIYTFEPDDYAKQYGEYLNIELVPTGNGEPIFVNVDKDGKIMSSDMDEFRGKNLGEVVGKEIAVKLMQSEPGSTIKGEGLRVGGEGMKGFYDEMLPRFMNKYGKKWGVKVGEIDLPDLEKSAQKMWSIDVTPEMKESVMQGQPMFQKGTGGRIYGWTDGTGIFLTPLGMNPNSPMHEYTHIWDLYIQKNDPKLWKEIVNTLKKTQMWQQVRENPNYRSIWNDDNRMASEVHSRLTGARSEEEFEKAAADPNNKDSADIIRQVKDVLRKFWEKIASLFGYGKDRLEEFVLMPLKDVLNGLNPISGETSTAFAEAMAGKMVERTLMGVHNLSEEKLRKVLKQGGLANPSLAVVDTKNHMHTDYGSISLIPKASLIDARTGRNAGTFTADAWTPTYPHVERRMTDKGQDKFWKDLRTLREEDGEMANFVRMAFDTWLDKETGQERLAYWYLKDKGMKPEIVRNKNPYGEDIVKRIDELTDNGNLEVSRLSEEQIKEVADMYHAYKESIGEPVTPAEERIKRLQERMNPDKPSPFLKLQQFRLDELAKYGELLHNLNEFEYAVRRSADSDGKPNVEATVNNAQKVVKDQNLQQDFEKWLQDKADSYGIDEWLYNGTDNQGRQKFVRNTLENASRLMRKEGLNGAVNWSSIGNWIAKVANKEKTLAGIRKNKKNLQTSEEEHEAFREKWGAVMHRIAEKIGNGDSWSGENIMGDILDHKDYAGYLKREYGMELSKEDREAIDTFINEVQTSYPTGYFETKFERPVMLDEFEIAVVPENTSADIIEALKNTGLDVRTYDDTGTEDQKDANRTQATMDAVTSRNDILFQIEGGMAGESKSVKSLMREGNLFSDADFQSEPAKAEKEISELSDEDLLELIGKTDEQERRKYIDAYDSRHEAERRSEGDAYADMLEFNNTSLNDAYDMFDSVFAQFNKGGYASSDRTKLMSQIDALERYIEDLEEREAERKLEEQEDADSQAEKQVEAKPSEAQQKFEQQKEQIRQKGYDLTNLKLRELKKDETCHVQRRYEENGFFSFTGKERIESIDDVAYIFKQLENASIENSFLVLEKDGVPTVIHLGVGNYTGTIAEPQVALAAYHELQPEKVYFIHNHPSGNLVCSRQDQDIMRLMRGIFGNKLQAGIIINTTSGKYGLFDVNQQEQRRMPESQEDAVPLKVYSFSKQVFDKDWNPETAFNGGTASNIAKFVSSHRLGKHKKMSLIVMTQNWKVTGNVFLPWTNLKQAASVKGADLIARYMNQMGGTIVTLYGNYDYTDWEKSDIGYLKVLLKARKVYLSDVIHIDASSSVTDYTSSREMGLLGEPSPEDNRTASETVPMEQAKNIEDVYADGLTPNDSIDMNKRVNEMSPNQLISEYKRVNADMLDENGLNIDEQEDKFRQEWIDKHGWPPAPGSGFGQATADFFNKQADKYGFNKMALRWDLLDRIEELGLKKYLNSNKLPEKTANIVKMYRHATPEIEKLNNEYNANLTKLINGKLDKGFVFDMGVPSVPLLTTGFPNLPIKMQASVLKTKTHDPAHPYSYSEVYDLVKQIQRPLAIFEYGDKDKAQNLMIGISQNIEDGKQFLVGLSLEPVVNGVKLPYNSVRNVFPKNFHDWIHWIAQGKLLRVDGKKEIQDIIDALRINPVDYIDKNVLNSVAKIVKDFQNPKLSEENLRNIYANLVRAGDDMADMLGGMKVVYESEAPESGTLGWYDPNDNTIHVVLPEHTDANEVKRTVCHEKLGHEGLVALMGDQNEVNKFGQFIFGSASKNLRKRIIEKADKEGYEWNDPLRFSKAAQEVFADIAENGPRTEEEFSLWRKVKHYIIRLLKKMNIRIRGLLNDHDLAYYVLKTGEALKRWNQMTPEAQKEAARQSTQHDIMRSSRRGKPRKRNNESMAQYVQRLREWERWKIAEEQAAANNDPMPDADQINEKWHEQFNRDMAEWKRQNNIEDGNQGLGEFPKREQGETPQEYAMRVADYETQADTWKNAPSVFDYLQRANDEYREAYKAWKERYGIREEESVDLGLYEGDPERMPHIVDMDDLEADTRADADLAEAVGIDMSSDGARNHTKLAIIERRKNLESANAEDAIWIHDLCKQIADEAKQQGVTPKELREALPDIIEGTYFEVVLKDEHGNIVSIEDISDELPIKKTAGLQAILDNIKDWYDEFFHVIEDAGLRNDAGYVEEGYVNHVWSKEKTNPEIWKKYVENFQRTKSPNMRERIFETYRAGEDIGLVRKFKDIADILAYYSSSNNQAVANKKFLDDLSFIVVEELNGDGEVVNVSPLLNSNKPNIAVADRYKMYHVPGVGDVWVLKEIERSFANIFGTMRTQDIPEWLTKLGKVYDVTSSTAKKIQLSFSAFHMGALTEVAMAQMRPDRALRALGQYIIFDCAKAGTIPAYAHPEDFKFAASHLVQLGATQDYSAADVNNVTEKLREIVRELANSDTSEFKGVVKKAAGLELTPLAAALDYINKGMDKVLWNYLHDGLKIACFKMFAEQIEKRVEKEGLMPEQREQLLDEAGQYVNDTFGGQYWELLNVSPALIKWLRRGFLSPDWLISTQRHFLANFGFGSLYSESGFLNYLRYNADNIKRVFGANIPKDENRRFRSKNAKQCYLLGVCGFFYVMMNAVNALFRAQDEEKEKEKAEEARKDNPEYKSPYELSYPDGMKWYDYTMYGNTIGQQTHLFLGRYDDGTEWYARWGKQFREFPELFMGRHGVEFPTPLMERMSGKANPVGRYLLYDLPLTVGMYGYKQPRETQEIAEKYGNTVALLAMTAKKFLPFSVPTQQDKEFKMFDLVMPSQKGFTQWKAIDYFKTYIQGGDMDGVMRTYNAAVMNGIDAEECLKAAISTVKATQRKEMEDGITDLQSAMEHFDAAKGSKERKRMKRKVIQYLADQNYKTFTRDEAMEQVNDFLNGTAEPDNDINKYVELQTSEDVRDDYRLDMVRKQAKKYVDEVKTAEGDRQRRLEDTYQPWIEIDNIIKDANKQINRLKRQLGKDGNDADLMQQIRTIRSEAQKQVDAVKAP